MSWSEHFDGLATALIEARSLASPGAAGGRSRPLAAASQRRTALLNLWKEADPGADPARAGHEPLTTVYPAAEGASWGTIAYADD